MIHEIIPNCVDEIICDGILEIMLAIPRWNRAKAVSQGGDISEENGFDNGFIMMINPNSENKSLDEEKLMLLGDLMVYNISRRTSLDIDVKGIKRYAVNYYNKSSKCISHTDSDYNTDVSVIVFLTQSEDDYTLIGDQKVFGNKGDVVLFDASTYHSSTGAINGTYRSTFNILIETNGGVK